MAATFDASSHGTLNDVATNILSWSHTTTASANRAMGVCISFIETTGTDSVSAVDYNGAAATFLAQSLIGGEVWGLAAPVSGANNVNVNWDGSGAKACVAGAISASGVDQVTPFGTARTNGNVGSTTPSVDVTGTDAAGLVIANLFVNMIVNPSVTATIAGTGTSRWNDSQGSILNLTRLRGCGSTDSGNGGTRTMSWTLSGSKPWGMVGVEMKPVAAVSVSLLPILGTG